MTDQFVRALTRIDGIWAGAHCRLGTIPARSRGFAMKRSLAALFALCLAGPAGADGIINPGSGGGSPTGVAGGDLSGSYPNPTVAKVNGTAPPNSGIFKGNGSGGVAAAVVGTDYQKWTGVTLQATPSAPAGTTSAVGVMAGLGATCTITPSFSTRIHVSFSGSYSNNTSTDSVTIYIRYSTGVAPSNGVALAGTAVGVSETGTSAAANALIPFHVEGVITGLTAGTAYWLDLMQSISGGGTGTISNVACTAFEF